MRDWSDIETAWFAGLLEGEGCFAKINELTQPPKEQV